MKTFEQLGEAAYAAYCKSVEAHAAKDLWKPGYMPWELQEDFQKAAWTAAAKQIAAEIAALH